jgi:hypothetical protein
VANMSGKLLDGFTKLNDISSLYRPKSSDKATSSDPDLYIYCSWMGAAAKHISKYIEGFKKLFPNTSILLVESTVPNMLLGSDLAPARQVVQSFSKTTDGIQPSIILHACSNGGAAVATRLASLLTKPNEPSPFSRVILDCSPGKGEAKSATTAMTMSLPGPEIVRIVGFWLIYSTTVLLMGIYDVLGWENLVSRLRRLYNEPQVISIQAPKLYLYSKNDLLVRWEHVHEHAEEAKQKGYVVREEVFVKAAHAALLMEDSERYWNAVKEHVLEVPEK